MVKTSKISLVAVKQLKAPAPRAHTTGRLWKESHFGT